MQVRVKKSHLREIQVKFTRGVLKKPVGFFDVVVDGFKNQQENPICF